eukprot:1139963-Pelagomonas_calceolata.AAC.7
MEYNNPKSLAILPAAFLHSPLQFGPEQGPKNGIYQGARQVTVANYGTVLMQAFDKKCKASRCGKLWHSLDAIMLPQASFRRGLIGASRPSTRRPHLSQDISDIFSQVSRACSSSRPLKAGNFNMPDL